MILPDWDGSHPLSCRTFYDNLDPWVYTSSSGSSFSSLWRKQVVTTISTKQGGRTSFERRGSVVRDTGKANDDETSIVCRSFWGRQRVYWVRYSLGTVGRVGRVDEGRPLFRSPWTSRGCTYTPWTTRTLWWRTVHSGGSPYIFCRCLSRRETVHSGNL